MTIIIDDFHEFVIAILPCSLKVISLDLLLKRKFFEFLTYSLLIFGSEQSHLSLNSEFLFVGGWMELYSKNRVKPSLLDFVSLKLSRVLGWVLTIVCRIRLTVLNATYLSE